jgi:signal transduction histidine kinase
LLLRAFAGAAFGLLAIGLGYGAHRECWAAAVPALAAYTALAAVSHSRVAPRGVRELLDACWPFIDILFVLFVLLHSLPLAQHPQAAAGWSIGLFALVIVLAAFTLPMRLTVAATGCAWAAQALLLREVHVGLPLTLASGLVLGLTATVTARGAQRLETLASQLVAEEVARRMALQRGDELEAANIAMAQVNARIEEQHARLTVAQRDAETLSSLIVHDMKQPLASIQGLLDLVGDQLAVRGDAKRLVEDLGVARAQGDRLLAMIADLLAIARLERGSLLVRRQRAGLPALLQQVARAHGDRARAMRVELGVRVEPDLFAALDLELVERSLENLVVNALTFARSGDRIELWAAREADGLALGVRNSGPQVPPDVRPLLFEKFVTRNLRARHNAGLGLYFCRLVAEAHGGRIALEDEPGWSVSFVVRLPERTPGAVPLGRLG